MVAESVALGLIWQALTLLRRTEPDWALNGERPTSALKLVLAKRTLRSIV